jgi:hypothetical protein
MSDVMTRHDASGHFCVRLSVGHVRRSEGCVTIATV